MQRKCHFPHKFRESNNFSKNVFRETQKKSIIPSDKCHKINGICKKDERQLDTNAADVLRQQLEEILTRMLSIWVKEIVSLKNFTTNKSGKFPGHSVHKNIFSMSFFHTTNEPRGGLLTFDIFYAFPLITFIVLV